MAIIAIRRNLFLHLSTPFFYFIPLLAPSVGIPFLLSLPPPSQPPPLVRAFFLCGFSNILKRCSIWLSGSTKAQKDPGKVLGDPVEEFRVQVRSMIQRNRLYWDDLVGRAINPADLLDRCSIRRQDARRLALADGTFDLLVTSPPYAISYEYKEIHQLSQLWF